MQIASLTRTRMNATLMHYVLLLWPIAAVAAAVPIALFMAMNDRAPRISDPE
jgi:hypothetical protein